MKRILLYVATNFAILAVLSVTMQLLGIDTMLVRETGLNLYSLLVTAAVFGFGGSFISLLISKWMAKMATGAQVIEVPSNQTERWLVRHEITYDALYMRRAGDRRKDTIVKREIYEGHIASAYTVRVVETRREHRQGGDQAAAHPRGPPHQCFEVGEVAAPPTLPPM